MRPLLRLTNGPAATYTENSYDGRLVLSTRDRAGNVTAYTYDALGNLGSEIILRFIALKTLFDSAHAIGQIQGLLHASGQHASGTAQPARCDVCQRTLIMS